MMKQTATRTAVVICVAITGSHGYGQEKSTQDLAKATQNPLASMISLPFQNNTDFGVGPGDDTRNTLNIQPVPMWVSLSVSRGCNR